MLQEIENNQVHVRRLIENLNIAQFRAWAYVPMVNGNHLEPKFLADLNHQITLAVDLSQELLKLLPGAASSQQGS